MSGVGRSGSIVRTSKTGLIWAPLKHRTDGKTGSIRAVLTHRTDGKSVTVVTVCDETLLKLCKAPSLGIVKIW